MIPKQLLALAVVCLPLSLLAQAAPHTLPLKFTGKGTTPAITAADLMARVYAFADDSMMGRAAGTIYHDKATDYLAREVARFGLKPGGDGGTFFQTIPLKRRELVQGAKLTVGGRDYVPGKDVLPRDNGPTTRPFGSATTVYGGVFGDSTMIDPAQTVGKVVVFTVPQGWQANRPLLVQVYLGAAAIVVASLDSMPQEIQTALSQPAILMDEASPDIPPVPPFLYVTGAVSDAMFGGPTRAKAVGASGATVSGDLSFVGTQAPGARNVIAILPGSDASVRGQYVAIGAHSDHIGFDTPVDHDSLYAFYHIVRPGGADDGEKPATPEDLPRIRALLDSLRRTHAARADSIYNGADDDGSGSMGLLEVAEASAAAREKPKRSLLFIWHVGEELGLYGSEYFTDHPTVPRDSIVAEINVDMIGRGAAADTRGGGPGYLQLIGARRLSSELGDIVEAEGKKFSPAFNFDYQYDANGHPQQFYCRSDHYMYARYGIPIVFMSTGGHPEYHQVTDEPEYIDYDHLARVAQLVYNTAWQVANLDHRLVVDKPKPDPHAQCVQ
jgi:hypothetical protein